MLWAIFVCVCICNLLHLLVSYHVQQFIKLLSSSSKVANQKASSFIFVFFKIKFFFLFYSNQINLISMCKCNGTNSTRLNSCHLRKITVKRRRRKRIKLGLSTWTVCHQGQAPAEACQASKRPSATSTLCSLSPRAYTILLSVLIISILLPSQCLARTSE